MFRLFKKRECSNCGKKTRKGINYAGHEICSSECMVEFFKDVTMKELIELKRKDREINPDFYEKLDKAINVNSN